MAKAALNPDQVAEVRRLYAGDARAHDLDGRFTSSGRVTQSQLAARFGVRQTTISLIVRGVYGKPRSRRPVLGRFMQKVEPEPTTGCWLWLGAVRKGYGTIRGEDSSERGAHRVAYELFNGPITEGQEVCHRCDTPLCVNPSHLFLGDQSMNSRDMWTKGRGVPPPRHHRGRHKSTCEGGLCGCYL